jgi:hypothetical protein
MLRESVYFCSYDSGEGEHSAHVLAWDDREAAELFASEIREDVGDVRPSDIRVEPVDGGNAESDG